MSHPQSSGVQHFGVFGEMHLNAAIVADRHRQLLQGFVPTVRTECSIHVARRPKSQTHSGSSVLFRLDLAVKRTSGSTV